MFSDSSVVLYRESDNIYRKLNITNGNMTSALNILIQTKEAIRLAEQAEDQIDDYKELFEEEERKIEVEIEGNQTKVEVARVKAKFV